MQTTITYLLTEQAQRAQMAVTGQPIARTQTVTVDLPPQHAALLQIAHDGLPYLDLTPAYPGPVHEKWAWRDLLGLVSMPDNRSGFSVANPDLAALIAKAADKIAAAKAYDMAYPTSILAADATLAEWVRAGGGSSSSHPPTIWREAIEACGLKPTDSRLYDDKYTSRICGPLIKAATAELLAQRAAAAKDAEIAEGEARYQRMIAEPKARLGRYANEAKMPHGDIIVLPDNHPRQADWTAELARRAAAHKDAAAAKEAMKTAAIDAWVAASGEPALIAQHADKLLCRETIIERMATTALDACGLPVEYRDSVVCDDCDCPCQDLVVECIPPAAYARWKAFALPEGSTSEFRRVRDCRGDVDSDDIEDRASTPYYVAIVTVPAGPFQFTRRVRLG